MISRYDDRIAVINKHDRYKEFFQERGVNYIRHFNSPVLRHPTEKEISTLTVLGKVWTVGDRFFKLAHDHYGDSRFWWVLAWFNRKPTDAHVSLGEVVFVPLPLDRVLSYIDV